MKKQRKLFCDINPTCYAISMKKENYKRYLQDLAGKDRFAREKRDDRLPNVVASFTSKLIKTGPGIDPVLQENKAVNIALACAKINGIIIQPGEIFSFWHLVGKTSERKGYKNGRVIIKNKIVPGLGGGLCNLGHAIHRVVLHSPLEVTEFHSHSDALNMDSGKRVPFGTGTSICYNHVDFRFRNNTDQEIQLVAYCKDGQQIVELRSERAFPWRYELTEEDLHYRKEGDRYFRHSLIFRDTIDRTTNEILKHELVIKNHSEVMFDAAYIPPEQIRNDPDPGKQDTLNRNKSDTIIAYYDNLAENYDENRFGNSYGKFIDAEERRILDQIFTSSCNERRLEIACGTGRLTNYATHGLDASNEMLARAKAKHTEVEFRQASADDTGYPDAYFDAVYSFHLLMHLDPEMIDRIFREVHRILKPGGKFVFDIPSRQRRELLHHRQATWHGGTELSTEDIYRLAKGEFSIRRSFGILFFPIHKLPNRLRAPLLRTDYRLANGRLKENSSYLVFELIRIP